MIFCSDPRREVSSLLLWQQDDRTIVPASASHSAYEEKSPQNPVRSPFTPDETQISIFDFAKLSREDQKQWLKASGSKSKDLPTSMDSTFACSSASSESSEKTEETDSISSFSSRSGDLCMSAVQKRSIFAPYWAKVGQDQNLPQQILCDTKACSSCCESKTDESIENSPRRSVIGCQIPLAATTTKDHQRLALPQIETVIATLLPERPMSITPNRRANSISAISILKKKDDHQLGRKRSNSFNVTFDSKVNVVLVFDDAPVFQSRTRTSPWWVRWLTVTGGNEQGVTCYQQLS